MTQTGKALMLHKKDVILVTCTRSTNILIQDFRALTLCIPETP